MPHCAAAGHLLLHLFPWRLSRSGVGLRRAAPPAWCLQVLRDDLPDAGLANVTATIFELSEWGPVLSCMHWRFALVIDCVPVLCCAAPCCAAL